MLTNDSVIEVFDDCFSVDVAKTIEKNLEIKDHLGYGWTYGHTAQKDNPNKQPFWMIDISSDPEHYKVFQDIRGKRKPYVNFYLNYQATGTFLIKSQ